MSSARDFMMQPMRRRGENGVRSNGVTHKKALVKRKKYPVQEKHCFLARVKCPILHNICQ